MRIQIVEDEKLIAASIERIIKVYSRFRVEVKVAYSGKSGIELAKSFNPPHLIITDICMRNMSGLDMIEALKKSNVKSKFIILSGHDNFEFAQQAIRNNVIDYLLKPLDQRRLIELIHQVNESIPKLYDTSGFGDVFDLPNIEIAFVDPKYPESLNKVIKYIKNNYMMDISLQSISEDIMLHTTYISKLINQHIGHNFSYVLNCIRIRKACELLISEKDIALDEVSYLVGYSSIRRLYEALNIIQI